MIKTQINLVTPCIYYMVMLRAVFRTPKPLHLIYCVPICLSAPHVTSVDE